MPVLSLRDITDDNRAAVEALVVTEEQSHYVAGVAESLAEASEHPDAKPWYRAVYADDEPVGFVMISDGITADNAEYVGPYYLWRLLIDHRFQRRGYGKDPALKAVLLVGQSSSAIFSAAMRAPSVSTGR